MCVSLQHVSIDPVYTLKINILYIVHMDVYTNMHTYREVMSLKGYMYVLFRVAEEGRGSPRSRVYYAQMTSAQFAELAQLCPDHNQVGDHLLSMARSLSATEQPTTGSEYHVTCTCIYTCLKNGVC